MALPNFKVLESSQLQGGSDGHTACAICVPRPGDGFSVYMEYEYVRLSDHAKNSSKISLTGVAKIFPEADNATPKEKDIRIAHYLVSLSNIVRGQATE